MKLKLQDIPGEGLDLEAKAGIHPWFDRLIQETFRGDYQKGAAALLEVHLLKTCENVSMTGSAKIDLLPTCGRCLETFDRHLITPIHINLAPSREQEADFEDVNFAFYQGDEIDLGNVLREILLLEVPIRYLCQEFCKGLCARCGQNLNTAACSCVKSQSTPPLKS